MTQADLFAKPTIQDAFERFHAQNPEVYDLLRKFALEALGAGRTKMGIKFIIERIRWEMLVVTRGNEFNINNNFSSRYARKLMAEVPELDGVFELRTLKA
jgi:hypothetical protein